jgi:ammonium transporter, Amt family
MESQQLVQDAWLLVSTALVFFMQPGFLCLEAGSVRRKNSVNVAMKNFIVELVSTTAFFAVGYSLMFGQSLSGWIGTPSFLLVGIKDRELYVFMFQAVFCGTAATIVSGAVAERLRFLPFVLESSLLCAFIYPLFGHWAWGGGWLSRLGYHDFAGSSVVHLMGASIAFAGVLVLGPRRGRYDSSGKPREIPAADLVVASLGTFILFFGWIGFNGGSAPFGDATARIVCNTLLAGCFGGLTCMLTSQAVTGTSSIGLILNGCLGGLVAITANADVVPVQASPVVGIMAGVAVHLASVLLDRIRLDDAVGALPVHGVCGILGVLCVPLFASADAQAAHFAATGLSRSGWLGIQALGAGACALTGIVGGLIVWKGTGLFTPLRVSPEGEEAGMNFSEHRLGDPLADMLQALRSVPAREVGMDMVRGGEFEPVARLVNGIVRESRSRAEESERWKTVVETESSRIEDLARSGRHQQEAMVAAMEEVRGKLDRLTVFARDAEGAKSQSALRVAGDATESLWRTISHALGSSSQGKALWDQLEQSSGLLSRLAGRIGRIPSPGATNV